MLCLSHPGPGSLWPGLLLTRAYSRRAHPTSGWTRTDTAPVLHCKQSPSGTDAAWTSHPWNETTTRALAETELEKWCINSNEWMMMMGDGRYLALRHGHRGNTIVLQSVDVPHNLLKRSLVGLLVHHLDLFRGQADVRKSTEDEVKHGDRPLFLPLSPAESWQACGRCSSGSCGSRSRAVLRSFPSTGYGHTTPGLDTSRCPKSNTTRSVLRLSLHLIFKRKDVQTAYLLDLWNSVVYKWTGLNTITSRISLHVVVASRQHSQSENKYIDRNVKQGS